MEADRHQPAARGKQLQRLLQAALHLPQLVIDVHAQRLEGAGRGMLARLAGAHAAAHQGRKLAGAGKRLGGARAHDLGGDAIGKALLTQGRDHVTNLIEARMCEPHGNWLAARRVHAHVERAVFAEAEAARGVVELRRGDAEIEQRAIAMRASCVRVHQRRKFVKLAVHQLQPSLVRKACAPGRDGRGSRSMATSCPSLPSASRMRALCPPRPNVAST